jgi:two-component system CheB/CheR fusion protein
MPDSQGADAGEAGRSASRRAEDEAEQLQVALEDALAQADALAQERDALRRDFAACLRRLHEMEAQRGVAPSPVRDDVAQARADATAEELRVAMEELHVFAEELEVSNAALSTANLELESRVSARTAELAEVNAQLRDSEERLQLAQAHASAGTWDWDIQARRVSWSQSYCQLYGIDPETAAPSYENWLDTIVPADREQAEAAIRQCLAHRRREFRVEYRIEHPLRGERWLAGRGHLSLDAKGEPARLLGIIFDVTERKQAQLALAEANAGLRREISARVAGEQRLRLLMEGVPQLIWRAVGEGSWSWSGPQWTSYTGQSEARSLGMGWLDMLHPDDREAALAAWADAAGDQPLESETRIFSRAHGRHRWFQNRAAPVRDAEGQVIEWLGTSTDIHDLRVLQERQKVMVAELQHRTRNLLGVVRGISSQTMREVSGLEEFGQLFGERLALLSRVQGLLSRADEQPITLGALLHMEVEAVGGAALGDRVRLEGPEVTLRNAHVQTLALAFHELATNARKYGALSGDEGRLDIRWELRRAGAGPATSGRQVPGRQVPGRQVHVEWRETGIVPLAEDAGGRRFGYGRELIERALPYSLGAHSSFSLEAEGLRCIIDLPLDEQDAGRVR